MRYLTTIFALCLCCTYSFAEELRGRVVSVADGDTITVLDASNTQHKIRLNGIDAPESAQDFGDASKQNLSALVFSKDVVVVWSKRDKYGRIIGTVLQGAMDASLLQLRDGFAWYYKQYEQDVPPVERVLYAAAEQAARSQLRGLWKQANAKAPWEFRHPEQSATPVAAAPAQSPLNSSAATSSATLPVSTQPTSPPVTTAPRASYRTYYRGPRGGCYYINGNGNKTYVDRSLCN